MSVGGDRVGLRPPRPTRSNYTAISQPQQFIVSLWGGLSLAVCSVGRAAAALSLSHAILYTTLSHITRRRSREESQGKEGRKEGRKERREGQLTGRARDDPAITALVSALHFMMRRPRWRWHECSPSQCLFLPLLLCFPRTLPFLIFLLLLFFAPDSS